jgi:ferric iron reductase protein FhuF
MDSLPSQCASDSPVEEALAALRGIDPKWRVDIGVPDESPGWISGTDFTRANGGAFPGLLNRIGERLRTDDRMTVAASFALRFGWSAWVAIVPYVVHQCVPEVSLDNISLKFGSNTLHERTAIHCPRGGVVASPGRLIHPLLQSAQNSVALLRLLRSQLLEQTQPMVDALYEWSGFSKKGAWGQITSSWTSHFVNAYGRLGDQAQALPVVQAFFEGDDEMSRMRPRLHALTLGDITHLYQRRASCCRYYLLPQGSLCASCPLVSHEECLAKNLDSMREQLTKRAT